MDRQKSKLPPPRNYLGRREQLRMLMLFMSLGLVVLLMIEASKPANWVWLTGEIRRDDSRARDEDYDTAYQPTLPAEEPLDTIRIVPTFDPMADDTERYFPGVVAAYLRDVEDYAPFRPQEAKSWYNLLEVLATNESHLFKDASSGAVSFAQLFEQPEVYRGALVTIRGEARRVEWKRADKEHQDLKGYYQLILRPKDGPPRPMYIYALTLPSGFPTDGDIREDIETTGFFFKNWNYPAGGTTWIAPVVLSRDFRWQPRGPLYAEPPSVWTMAVTATAVGFVAILFTCGVFWRSRHLFSKTRYADRRTVTPEDIAKLKDVPQAPPVGQQLRDLAAQE